MAHDIQHLDLPSELWFKVIAFVLSDSIYSICCSTTGAAELSWERNAFGTLRLVSKSFSHTAFKVADLALLCAKIQGAIPVDGEGDKSTDVDGDEKVDDPGKLKLIYDRLKMANDIHSNPNILDVLSQSGVTILSAYYWYAQLIKNCKTFFSSSGFFSVDPNLATNVFVPLAQQHLEFVEQVYDSFPIAIRNILSTLNRIAVPEMVEKLIREIKRDARFITAGMEVVYRCAQVIKHQDELQSPDISKKFGIFLEAIYVIMKVSAEFYSSELKDRVPGEYPSISKLPGVGMATGIIVYNGHPHSQALAGLVNSWAVECVVSTSIPSESQFWSFLPLRLGRLWWAIHAQFSFKSLVPSVSVRHLRLDQRTALAQITVLETALEAWEFGECRCERCVEEETMVSKASKAIKKAMESVKKELKDMKWRI